MNLPSITRGCTVGSVHSPIFLLVVVVVDVVADTALLERLCCLSCCTDTKCGCVPGRSRKCRPSATFAATAMLARLTPDAAVKRRGVFGFWLWSLQRSVHVKCTHVETSPEFFFFFPVPFFIFCCSFRFITNVIFCLLLVIIFFSI